MTGSGLVSSTVSFAADRAGSLAQQVMQPPAPTGVRVVAEDPIRCLVTVSGELDLDCSARLAEILGERVDAGRRFVRVDVSQVTFADSTAIEVLLAVHHRLLAGRGTLIITGVGRPISRLLALTGLDGVLFAVEVPDLGATG